VCVSVPLNKLQENKYRIETKFVHQCNVIATSSVIRCQNAFCHAVPEGDILMTIIRGRKTCSYVAACSWLSKSTDVISISFDLYA
jgi:hypothetical protein